MAKTIIAAVFFLYIGSFAAVLFSDLRKNYDAVRSEDLDPRIVMVFAPIIIFIATVGVPDFLMNTLFFKKFNLVEDRLLPGSLLTAACFPLSISALIFLIRTGADIKLVIVCAGMQAIGAITGVNLVSGFDGKTIKKAVGIAMLVSAFFLAIRLIGVIPQNGSLQTLPMPKLIICGILAFFIGMCQMMGMGAKAPLMSLLLVLGLAPDCVLPVVMTACSFSGLNGAIRYVKKGIYARKLSMYYSVFGLIGVVLGMIFVANLNQTVLQIIMIGISIYTGVTMLCPTEKSKA